MSTSIVGRRGKPELNKKEADILRRRLKKEAEMAKSRELKEDGNTG